MEGAIAAPSLESMADGRAEAEREKAERAENERREQERMKELERQEADPPPATFSILKWLKASREIHCTQQFF